MRFILELSALDISQVSQAEAPVGYTFVYPVAKLHAMGSKDAGIRIRLERTLREEFRRACRAKDQTAAQVLREFMKTCVTEYSKAASPASARKKSRK